jgi:hypothetical protein
VIAAERIVKCLIRLQAGGVASPYAGLNWTQAFAQRYRLAEALQFVAQRPGDGLGLGGFSGERPAYPPFGC